MTEDATLPPRDSIQPVDLQVEMQRSYLDYAMSVIVSRALPDVRDGLKPVHRRVLYAMYDGGYRPDRGYSKCSRVVGDVMGQYHPHGDSAIYDALVRLAQTWSMRYPLVDGQGNFGSRGNDPPAAMRYCIVGDTRVRTWDRGSVRIADLVPGAAPNSDNDVDLKLVGKNGEPVCATRLFHSGDHPTLRMRTREGFSLTGTHNHPVLCIVDVGGVPTLLWKLLEELRPGDHVVVQRSSAWDVGIGGPEDVSAAELAGAFVSEGFISETRSGFNSVDEGYFRRIVAAYDRVVGGTRYISRRVIASGSALHELDVQDLTYLRKSVLREMIGLRGAEKRIPEFVWRLGPYSKAAFLRSLFTGDGSVSRLAGGSLQIAYSTCSAALADGVQHMLAELGVIARQCRYDDGEIKVYVSSRREIRRFWRYVGFIGPKQRRLERIIVGPPARSAGRSEDHVPHLAAYLRRSGNSRSWEDRDWLQRHSIDRIARWEADAEAITTRLTPESRAIAEPLVDGRFYYAEVAEIADAGVQPVYSVRVDTDDHAFVTDGIISHNTECRMARLAMEMVRSIDEETVDFSPNYDGETQEPDVLPSRFPNLLVNGASGIAVGMATNIPPHNLREVATGVQWLLDNPEATNEELLEALLERIKGPDFPTGALIVGTRAIEQAYRTGRGAITMRAVVDVEEDNRGRTVLVVTELPYMVNPDNLAQKIADLANTGRVQGIADIRDESSARVGQRLVVVLKRDAVAKVVLNNLYKHTQLQDTFGANMLALVDGVPRTLSLDGFVRHWVDHQIDVIVRRTRFRLRKREERLHIVRALLKAIDRIDEVIQLIRASESAAVAQTALMDFLDIDEVQARAILDMQLRKLAALERQELQDEHDALVAEIAELNAILASPQRQREIVGEELGTIVDQYGDERRTVVIPDEGDMTAEDLIPHEDVVVTITHGGYAKRTKSDLYRSQRRGGRGVRGAQLKQDDIVEHFFVTDTHQWILFFTNMGRVYRIKAYQLPEAARDARGQHVANLVAFQPDERIAGVLAIRDYEAAPYLVVATKNGLVKKSRLSDYDSPRTGGLIAVNLREGDELIGARLVGPEDDILLVSRKGMSIRFHAHDAALRPMGRATSGVIGMRFRNGDELLALGVVRPDSSGSYVFTATSAGYAKRTPVDEWTVKGRGGIGIKAMRTTDERGVLVGALIVGEGDELYAITAGGGVIRTRVTQGELRPLGRDTMGVRLINLADGDEVVAIAWNAEAAAVDEPVDEPGEGDA